jgi:hypothetical protein
MKGHKSQGEARLMALEEHSFRHLLLTFLISRGTQVVLKADRPLQDGSVRQRGSGCSAGGSSAMNGTVPRRLGDFA